jgi:hypothetical protein
MTLLSVFFFILILSFSVLFLFSLFSWGSTLSPKRGPRARVLLLSEVVPPTLIHPFIHVFNLRRYDHLYVLSSSGPSGYLFSGLCRARSSKMGNFIFSESSRRGSILVSGIRLWNGILLVIKESRSVVTFEGALFAHMGTVCPLT